MNISTRSSNYDWEDLDDDEEREIESPVGRGGAETNRTNVNDDYLPTVHDRLYHEAKETPEKKIEKDVLITTLSSDTIRWIKRRRTMEAKHRVAITHFREGQLREIFDGLDFDSLGIIDLDELKNAVQYAEDQLKGKRGPSFKDVGKMFEAMDEDGNGEVDYHEFMIAMTGSSKSLIDIASEQDIEKLRAKFKEYAVKKKREHFIKCIGVGDSNERPSTTATNAPGAGGGNNNNTATGAGGKADVQPTDIDKCKYFTALFNIGGPNDVGPGSGLKGPTGGGGSSRNLISLRHQIAEQHPSPNIKIAPNSPQHIERFLDPFAGIDSDSMENNHNPTKKDLFYYQLEARIREERRQAYTDLQKDSEARDVENRVLHEKQYIQEVRKPGPYDCRHKGLKRQGQHTLTLSPIKTAYSTKQCIDAKLAALKDAKAIRKEQQLRQQRQQARHHKAVANALTDASQSMTGRIVSPFDLEGIAEGANENDDKRDDDDEDYNIIYDGITAGGDFTAINIESIPPRMPSASAPVSASAGHALNHLPTSSSLSSNPSSRAISGRVSITPRVPSRGNNTISTAATDKKPGTGTSTNGATTTNNNTHRYSGYHESSESAKALAKQRLDLLQESAKRERQKETMDKYVLELNSIEQDKREVGILSHREQQHQKQALQRSMKQSTRLKPMKQQQSPQQGLGLSRSTDNFKSVLLNCLTTPKMPLSASLSALPAYN